MLNQPPDQPALLARDGNWAVVTMPGRRFPAIACQGDTFKGVLERIRMIAALAAGTEAGEEAAYLMTELDVVLDLYSSTLARNGYELPWRGT